MEAVVAKVEQLEPVQRRHALQELEQRPAKRVERQTKFSQPGQALGEVGCWQSVERAVGEVEVVSAGSGCAGSLRGFALSHSISLLKGRYEI